MIITRTPYRIGLLGGGSDLPAHYRPHGGHVVNIAVAKYFYVSVCKRFLPDYCISYTQTERPTARSDIRHGIVRTALERLDIDTPLEISMIGEVPARTGLGSSSAVTVGVLHALRHMLGDTPGQQALAAQACTLEIDWMGRTMGRQDQYGCALGGAKLLRFDPDDTVSVRNLSLSPAARRVLEEETLVLFVGQRSQDTQILERQSQASADQAAVLCAMADQAVALADRLEGDLTGEELGRHLDEGWALKRSIVGDISSDSIDELYQKARALGAWGGKLLGAGGSGFLLLVAPRDAHDALRAHLGHPLELPLKISDLGSQVIFDASKE